MKYVLVVAQKCNLFGLGASGSRLSITEDLARARGPGREYGNFIGGSPRVVRMMGGDCSAGTESISAAWLFGIPEVRDPPSGYYDGLIRELEQRLSSTVRRSASSGGNWSRVSVIPFDPRVHGSEDFWRSGEAARTATADAWRAGAPIENPIGPNRLIDRSGPDAKTYVVAGGVALGAAALLYVTLKIRAFRSRRREAKEQRELEEGKMAQQGEAIASAVQALLSLAPPPPKKKGFFDRFRSSPKTKTLPVGSLRRR